MQRLRMAALALAVLAASTAAVPARQETTAWGRLGPPGPQPIRVIAAGPGWPQDGLLLAIRDGSPEGGQDQVVRSRDGGASWERLPAPADGILELVLAPTTGPLPVAFATTGTGLYRSTDAGESWQQVLAHPGEPANGRRGNVVLTLSPTFARDGVAFYAVDGALYRSTSLGATWKQVLVARDRASTACPEGGIRCDPACPEYVRQVPALDCPEVIVSPDVASDGLVFYRAHFQLYRSRDGGVSWTRVEAAGEQLVQQVLTSPDFGRDATLVLAATSGPFPEQFIWDQPYAGPAGDHEQSLGILVSSDGGGTWTAASGLEVDGVPYRHVQRLAISPTFAQDGTLFAFAWGPREPTVVQQEDVRAAAVGAGRVARSWRAALFRSTDRGTSWTPVATFGPAWDRPYPVIQLSPRFAADGVAMLALNTPARESYQCSVTRTGDGGTTWEDSSAPVGPGCGRLRLFESGGQLQRFIAAGSGWLWSPDGGATWEEFTTPAGIPVARITPVRMGAQEFLLVGGRGGGIWAFGPGASTTAGRLPCPAQASLGFGRVWQAEVWVQERLGCPTEAERPVRIRYQELSRSRGVWTDDDRAEWFDLFGLDGTEPGSFYTPRSKAEPGGWPSGPEQVLAGAAQRYEGGTMLWVPYPDGRRTILVLAQTVAGGQWHEYPDPGASPTAAIPAAPRPRLMPGTITTVAGNHVGVEFSGGDGGPATRAALHLPQGLAVGPDGGLYIADSWNQRVRRVAPDGTITTVAGDGTPGFGGDGGPATRAQLHDPAGIALGPDGSLYVADTNNARVRRVGADGNISTVAGDGTEGYDGDGGPATSARLSRPWGVAVAPDGSLFIADTGNSVIRQVRPDGSIVTAAGSAAACDRPFWESCFGGDGGPAADAQLRPASVAVGPDGGLYIADSWNHRVRRMGLEGTITTVAGDGRDGAVAPPGDGGPATGAPLRDPRYLASGTDGSLYIAEPAANVVRKVWWVTTPVSRGQ